MKTDQLRKHLQLFTEGTPVPTDDLPGDTPATSPDKSDLASRVKTVDGEKIVELTAAEEAAIRKLLQRMDTLLTNYTDPATGKHFESIDFESMTESEQHQYIMQNLHLLSEADQMTVLRAITNEDKWKTAGDIATKYGIPAVKKIWDTGEKMVGWTANKVALPLIQNIGQLLKWTAIGTGGVLGLISAGGLVYLGARAPWDKVFRAIFPDAPAVDKALSSDDRLELQRIEQEFNNIIREPYNWLGEQGILYKFSPALSADIREYQDRWEKFSEAMKKRATQPQGPRPPLMQRLQDLVK